MYARATMGSGIIQHGSQYVLVSTSDWTSREASHAIPVSIVSVCSQKLFIRSKIGSDNSDLRQVHH